MEERRGVARIAEAEERSGVGEANLLSEKDFMVLAERHGIVPVAHRVPLSGSPMEIYRACRGGASFLCESDATGPHSGRFAIIGIDPERVFRNTERRAETFDADGRPLDCDGVRGILDLLRRHVEEANAARYAGLPPFFGGAAGYFAHEAVEDMDDLFHDRPECALPRPQYPKALLFSPGTVLTADLVERTLTVIRNARILRGMTDMERRALYRNSVTYIGQTLARVRGAGKFSLAAAPTTGALRPNRSRAEFLDMVARGKALIAEGDLYQIVLSQRFDASCVEDPLDLFAALRRSNPSPYMFLFEFPELAVVGSSPEMLVRIRGRKVVTRPLAGTRPRGASVAEDLALEAELHADGKECAEHVMLVDLSRNDLSRVSLPGSVVVTEEMGVDRYTRVMHLVSQVEGVLRPECDAFDALCAAFPAGTLSGAPKIRALERIAEIEGEPRGVYGGAIGFLDFGGDLETCIAIRTLTLREGALSLQVGAGIVADSDPESEYAETLHKGRALFEALGCAKETGGAR